MRIGCGHRGGACDGERDVEELGDARVADSGDVRGEFHRRTDRAQASTSSMTTELPWGACGASCPAGLILVAWR